MASTSDMACPLFIPEKPLSDTGTVTAPLGRLHDGRCGAGGEAIPENLLLGCCNYGYGRGSCPRAAESEVDAVRFLVTDCADNEVRVAWSIERDHRPLAVGSETVNSAGQDGDDSPILRLQMRARARVFLRYAKVEERGT